MDNKSFYLWIKGQKVEVSEEVYRAYIRPIRNEWQRKRREKRCLVMGEKGYWIRCKGDCSMCNYELSGKRGGGGNVSLEILMENGFDIESEEKSAEDELFQDAEKTYIHKALKHLTNKQMLVVYKRIWEEKTFRQIGEEMGVNDKTVRDIFDGAKEKLKKILKNF